MRCRSAGDEDLADVVENGNALAGEPSEVVGPEIRDRTEPADPTRGIDLIHGRRRAVMEDRSVGIELEQRPIAGPIESPERQDRAREIDSRQEPPACAGRP